MPVRTCTLHATSRGRRRGARVPGPTPISNPPPANRIKEEDVCPARRTGDPRAQSPKTTHVEATQHRENRIPTPLNTPTRRAPGNSCTAISAQRTNTTDRETAETSPNDRSHDRRTRRDELPLPVHPTEAEKTEGRSRHGRWSLLSTTCRNTRPARPPIPGSPAPRQAWKWRGEGDLDSAH